MDSNGRSQTSPDLVKETVTAYFEQLYKAHDHQLFNQEWTAHVKESIAKWQKDVAYDAHHLNHSISTEETSKVIQKLKKMESVLAQKTSRMSSCNMVGKPLSELLPTCSTGS